jgi:hypothetical protein
VTRGAAFRARAATFRPRAVRPHARLALAAGIALLAAGLTALPALAADPTFGKATIDASFETGIVITQPVTVDAPPARVEILLRYADSPGPLVIEVPPPTVAGSSTLRYTVAAADGHILPNTPVEARWRITPVGGGTPVVGPSVRDVVDDARFEWQTATGDIVRVHWYAGGKAFGQRALDIGEKAVARTAKLLGVTEEQPVDFFIYADKQAFYDALGPGTRENVGGQANAGIRTLFALITPGEIDAPWVGIVVPHELTHLVFDTAASNPYHFPPRWLNEGLAVYLSQGNDASDRAMVSAAVDDRSIIPLSGLRGQFPTAAQQFFLAYAESVSAVDFLIRTHGEDALVSLISSYAEGRTDDEAFTAAIGMDTAAFDAAWLADLGAETPVRLGPQAAPLGPQPAGWGAPAVPGASAPPATAPSAGASPAASGGPAPGDASGSPGDGGGATTILLVAGAVLVVVLVVVLVRRRSRLPGAGAA